MEAAALLTLCGPHHVDDAQARHEGRERSGVRRRDDVPYRDASRCLLESEVPQVREEKSQLLLVVRPPRRFLRALDDDDAKLLRRLPGEGTDGVAQLIVRNEEPASVLLAMAMRAESFTEMTHGRLTYHASRASTCGAVRASSRAVTHGEQPHATYASWAGEHVPFERSP